MQTSANKKNFSIKLQYNLLPGCSRHVSTSLRIAPEQTVVSQSDYSVIKILQMSIVRWASFIVLTF